MRPEQLALMIPIITTLGAFTMIVFIRRYQNIERMSMIERGMNPRDLKDIWHKRQRDPYRHVRLACTAIGVGVGLLLGTILRGAFSYQHGGSILAGMIFICGGIGLLAGYIIQMSLQSKLPKDNKTDNENDYDDKI